MKEQQPLPPVDTAEEVEDAIRQLQVRCYAGLQNDGSLNRNVKDDWSVERADGVQLSFGNIANGYTVGEVDGGSETWKSLGSSAGLQSGRAYLCSAATLDGLFYIGVRGKPSSSNGLLEIYAIADGIVQAGTIGTIDSAKLDSPSSQLIVVSPSGSYCAVSCNNW